MSHGGFAGFMLNRKQVGCFKNILKKEAAVKPEPNPRSIIASAWCH